jgi:hypothetical protein
MSEIWTTERKCSIEGCELKHEARGYCKKHYTRWVRHGNALANKQKRPLIDRFNERYTPVPGSGCWLWTAALTAPDGYGSLMQDGKRILAHRFSWEYHNSLIPEGLCVLHKCDVKSCVNPDHLYVGTIKDNSIDAIKRDRFKYKIKNAELPQLFDLKAYGFLYKEIAEMYKVSIETIQSIMIGKRRAYARDL